MSELTVGLLLFPTFEVLDMAGPIEALNVLAVWLNKPLRLHVIGQDLAPVSPGPVAAPDAAPSFTSQQLYLPTTTLADAPPLDLLIVPGGPGPDQREALAPFVAFIRDAYHGDAARPPLRYLFSVCSGALLLAWAGVLDGHRATTNKAYWRAITPAGPRTHWVARARWVASADADGNGDARLWTASGVSAGLDAMLALIARIWGEEAAAQACAIMEYNRTTLPDEDPWAEKYECRDVLPVAVEEGEEVGGS
nr:isonitrile hydratase [Quercus suber]